MGGGIMICAYLAKRESEALNQPFLQLRRTHAAVVGVEVQERDRPFALTNSATPAESRGGHIRWRAATGLSPGEGLSPGDGLRPGEGLSPD